MARTMLKAKGMPSRFWGEAVMTAVCMYYVLNRSFTCAVDGKTPFEPWHGRKPDLEHLRPFGCVVYAKVTRPGLKKLDDRTVKAMFIGYKQSRHQGLPIVASEPDRPDRGTGSRNGVPHAGEQGSVRGTHLWYAKLDRGSRSTLVWIDEAESRVLISPNMMLKIEDINRPKYDA
jgi:hypothetical protein